MPNISDVDTFAVIKPNSIVKDESWTEEAESKLSREYPFTADVEIALVPFDEILERGSPSSVVLKTQSVCIYGNDLQYQIRAYKPDREVIDQAFFLAEKIKLYEKETVAEEDDAELKEWCIWTMKGIVRSGFELVIEEEGAYTRDLYLCYATFIKYYSDKKEQMYQALEWSINPISERGRVLLFLREFGRWLCRQIEIRYPTKKLIA